MFSRVLNRLLEETGRSMVVSLGVLAIMLLPWVTAHLYESDVGARVQWEGDGWVVTWVDPAGPAAAAGLRAGDVVVSLDGAQPAARRKTDPSLNLSAASEWAVLRDGHTLAMRPAWQRTPWYDFSEPVAFLTIALAFWGVAVLVRLLKPGDELAREFYKLNVAAAIVLALTPAAGADIVWAKVVEVLAFAHLPALFLGFTARFARGAPPMGRTIIAIRALLVVGVGCGVLYLLAGEAGSEWYYSLRVVLLGLLSLGIISGLAVLLMAYVRPRSPDARPQIQIVLVSAVVAAAPLTILSLIPASLGASPILRPQFAALTAILLPAGSAYAIVRHRFFGIDVVAERALVYGAMTFLLAGCYALFLYGLGFVGDGPIPHSTPILSLLFFAALTMTFIPVRDRLRLIVDHLIYRDRYDYVRTLRALGYRLASPQPIDRVLSDVANSLARTMNLRGAAVFTRNADGELVMRVSTGDPGDMPLAQSVAGGTAGWTGQNPAGPGRWIQLVVHGEEIGVLYLAPKRSGVDFSVEDLTLAETIASQAAVAIANALLVERLQGKVAELELLGDRLLRVQEEERKRLAEVIHDGPLHTVLDLVRQADTAPHGAPLGHPDGDGPAVRLHELAERGRDAVHELRTICSDLYPSELAHLGLVAALESLVSRTNRDESVVVRFSTEGFPEDCRLTPPVEDTLYRVAREALDNACRHAEADAAVIELRLEDREVELTVRDDGRGFVVPASPAALLRSGHLGLATMHERVERLRGRLRVVSAPGKGTEVRVRIHVVDDLRTGIRLLPGARR